MSLWLHALLVMADQLCLVLGDRVLLLAMHSTPDPSVCNSPEWCECNSDCNPTMQVEHTTQTTHSVGSSPDWELSRTCWTCKQMLPGAAIKGMQLESSTELSGCIESQNRGCSKLNWGAAAEADTTISGVGTVAALMSSVQQNCQLKNCSCSLRVYDVIQCKYSQTLKLKILRCKKKQ